jgi:N-methylhydantoinase A
MHRAVDLRYLGQEHTVTLAVTDLADWADLRKQFDDAHERAYGYAASDVDIQLVNLRLTIVFPIERPRLPSLPRRSDSRLAFQTRTIYSVVAGEFVEHRVVQRGDLLAGDTFDGPAAIEEPGTTTIIDVGDTLSVEEHGCLMIQIGGR